MIPTKTLALGFTALTLMLTACAANTDEPPAGATEDPLAMTTVPTGFTCNPETANGLDMFKKASRLSTRTGGAPKTMPLYVYCHVTRDKTPGSVEKEDWIAVTYTPHVVSPAMRAPPPCADGIRVG